MADSTREDRIILTVGAIGCDIASDPEVMERFQKQIRLENALEPFRRKDKGKKRKHRAFGAVLDEERSGRTPD